MLTWVQTNISRLTIVQVNPLLRLFWTPDYERLQKADEANPTSTLQVLKYELLTGLLPKAHELSIWIQTKKSRQTMA